MAQRHDFQSVLRPHRTCLTAPDIRLTHKATLASLGKCRLTRPRALAMLWYLSVAVSLLVEIRRMALAPLLLN
jgi:hypothetical protein